MLLCENMYLLLTTALILKFEEPRYSVLEGDVIQVCLIAEGLTDSSFTAFIEISDITAFG